MQKHHLANPLRKLELVRIKCLSPKGEKTFAPHLANVQSLDIRTFAPGLPGVVLATRGLR
jgi:hypothetical protein